MPERTDLFPLDQPLSARYLHVSEFRMPLCMRLRLLHAGGCRDPDLCLPFSAAAANPFKEHTQQWNCSFHSASFLFCRLNGASDYQGVCGVEAPYRCYMKYTHYNGVSLTCCQNRGMFRYKWSGLLPEQVTDGMSRTIFVTELGGRPNWWTRGEAAD